MNVSNSVACKIGKLFHIGKFGSMGSRLVTVSSDSESMRELGSKEGFFLREGSFLNAMSRLAPISNFSWFPSWSCSAMRGEQLFSSRYGIH